ncbi:MAG TPA: hypothetical protein VF526_05235 [Solirubrobacteraceae bacterium]
MGAGPSFFRRLRLVAQADPDTLIDVTLDVAPGPGAQAIPLLERRDGPCDERNLHARGYSDQRALEFSLRVRFTKAITGYSPTKVRRATATLIAPADTFLFYTSDEIRWTDVLQRSPINKRIQADLDAHGCQIAVFEIPHEPDAVGLVIRRTLLEALSVSELDIIVLTSPPDVPALERQQPPAPPRPGREEDVVKAFVGFVFAALLIIVAHLVEHL